MRLKMRHKQRIESINMRKLSLTLLMCAASAFSLSQVKLSSPADTIQSLASAIRSGHVDNAAKCVKGAKIQPGVRKLLEQVATQGFTVTVVVQKPSISGAKASAQIAETIQVKGQASQTMNETVALAKSGSSWLIVAPVQAPQGQSFVNMAAFMLVKGDQFQARQVGAAKASVCLTNVKQLALGCIMFSADNDDILKLGSGTWAKSIMPYIKNKAVFTCPLDKSGAASYSFNAELTGKNSAVIADPAKTVLLYEGKNKKLDFRHDGRATVGFADGHVKLVKKEEAKDLKWKP